MRIAVTGASGYVGSALVPVLEAADHRVIRLVRRAPREALGEVGWDPGDGTIDAAGLEGVDAAVHLAGESIMGIRWTSAKKRRIYASRVDGTTLLAGALAGLARPPSLLVSCSAVGYYGDRGDEVLREESGPGAGFLAGVGIAWEQAAAAARDAGIRVVSLRMSPVVGPDTPFLRSMLPIFRLGLGGWFGSGRQYWPWVDLADVVGAVEHVLTRTDLSGPINLAAPRAVTNMEFVKTLGRVLGRPVLTPVVSPLARLIFGEVAGDVLLASQRVEPARLLQSGYRFKRPELESALRHALGRH